MATTERDLVETEAERRLAEAEREIADLRERLAAWESTYDKVQKREIAFTTISGMPVQPLYTPLDHPEEHYLEKLGFPGEFPFTRGPYSTI